MTTDIALRTGLDRLRYAVLFEAILIGFFSVGAALLFGQSLVSMGGLAITLAIIALAVNLIYNYVFDRFDAYYGRIPTQRTSGWRIVHALGFETTLVIVNLPIIMGWMNWTFWQAIAFDIGAMAAVVVYTYGFTLAYDKLFPVAQPSSQHSTTG